VFFVNTDLESPVPCSPSMNADLTGRSADPMASLNCIGGRLLCSASSKEAGYLCTVADKQRHQVAFRSNANFLSNSETRNGLREPENLQIRVERIFCRLPVNHQRIECIKRACSAGEVCFYSHLRTRHVNAVYVGVQCHCIAFVCHGDIPISHSITPI